MEFRLLLRNGEQLLLALVIPLVLLLLLGGTGLGDRVPLGDGRAVDQAVPRVLALAVLSTSFTSLAIATGFERRYGVIKRLGASPLSRTGLLAGKIGAVLAVQLIQLVVLTGVGAALGWQPHGGVTAVLGVVLMVLCGRPPSRHWGCCWPAYCGPRRRWPPRTCCTWSCWSVAPSSPR
jgi:ABC-2 type transport system permease protein